MTEICLHLVTENLFLQTIAAIELYCFTNTSIWFTTSYIGYSVERHQSRLGRFFFQINFCTTYTRNVMLFLHIAKKFISPSNFFRKTRCPWNKESCYVYIPITYKIWFHTNFWGLVKHQFHYINIVGVYLRTFQLCTSITYHWQSSDRETGAEFTTRLYTGRYHL